MPYLVISIDITKGRLANSVDHDAELSAILQQCHSAMVMRALPQELYDTDRTVVGEVRYQEYAPDGLARAKEQAAGLAGVPPAGGTRKSRVPEPGRTGARKPGKPKHGDPKTGAYPPAVRYTPLPVPVPVPKPKRRR